MHRGFTVLPPARHHSDDPDRDSCAECHQHHQYQRCTPLRSEEEVHYHVALVIQRKCKKGKKNGCLEQPQEVFHTCGPMWIKRFYGVTTESQGIC